MNFKISLNGKKTVKNLSINNFFRNNKFPILVTVIFFFFTSYVSFFVDNPARGSDAMYYFFAGKQILFGDKEGVKVPNAPIGGPILFASLNVLFNNPYLTIKIISLLSGTGIVFFSYYIIKHIFNFKIALLGQLIVAVNPKLHIQSTFPFNEIFPIFLIFVSFYFITKARLLPIHLVIVGLLLGASFMIRYQTLPVIIAFLIFLLIYDKKIRKNAPLAVILIASFLVGISPLIIYNYTTFGVFIDGDPNYYMATTKEFTQTPEWKDKVDLNTDSPLAGIFADFDLFLKNYFYNLFYHNPDRIFNFSGGIDNISPTPPIPFLGLILIFGGLIYYLKSDLKKKFIIFLIVISLSVTSVITFLGIFETYFFATIIIPLLILVFISYKKIEKKFLPLLIAPVVYFFVMSIIPITRADYFFAVWIIFPTLSSLFLLEMIPNILSNKYKQNQVSVQVSYNTSIKVIILCLIVLLLLVNLAFSYKLMSMIEYGDKSFDGVIEEIQKLFHGERKLKHLGIEVKQIGDVLSNQQGIENSYVMTANWAIPYYADSKLLFADFVEGNANETLDSYITRENWSNTDIYISNILSIPLDRNNINKPIPDYLIYTPTVLLERPDNLKILENPKDPRIPSNFELLYKSDITGTLVYKIHHKVN